MSINLSSLLTSSSIGTITSWIYNSILKTRVRLPIFMISLHIYVTQLAFTNYTGNHSYIIVYLSLIAAAGLIWEFVFPIWATRLIPTTCLSGFTFALFSSLSHFINLSTIGLFATSGLPLTYLISNYSQIAIIAIISSIFIFNYGFDWFEEKLWGDKYWGKLIAERDQLEQQILTNIDNIDSSTLVTSLPTEVTNVIDEITQSLNEQETLTLINNHHPPESTTSKIDKLSQIFLLTANRITAIVENNNNIKLSKNKNKTVKYNDSNDSNFANNLAMNLAKQVIDSIKNYENIGN